MGQTISENANISYRYVDFECKEVPIINNDQEIVERETIILSKHLPICSGFFLLIIYNVKSFPRNLDFIGQLVKKCRLVRK